VDRACLSPLGTAADLRYPTVGRGRTGRTPRILGEKPGSTPGRQDASDLESVCLGVSETKTVARLPEHHPFRRHAQNLREVLVGLTQIERFHKDAIRGGQSATIRTAARLHALVVGFVAEARLRKIVSDPDGFNDRERKLIAQAYSQVDRWERAVELGFRRHYAVPMHLEIDEASTSVTIESQYRTLIELLDKQLRPIIEDRNKTAHAQWLWHLNSRETAFVGNAPPVLNYRAIQRRSELIDYLSRIIHALAVSEPTFQRDFADTYATILTLMQDIDGSDYPDLVQQLRQRAKPKSSHRYGDNEG
jgi:hypothetical protein